MSGLQDYSQLEILGREGVRTFHLGVALIMTYKVRETNTRGMRLGWSVAYSNFRGTSLHLITNYMWDSPTTSYFVVILCLMCVSVYLQSTVDWFRIYKVPAGKPINKFAFDGKAKKRVSCSGEEETVVQMADLYLECMIVHLKLKKWA